MPDNETLNTIFPNLTFIAIAVLFFWVVSKERYCATCQRSNALEKTGIVETRNNNEEWEEYRCRYCDFHDWRKRVVGGGGGGGSGGDGGADGGGCGGCGGCGG